MLEKHSDSIARNWRNRTLLLLALVVITFANLPNVTAKQLRLPAYAGPVTDRTHTLSTEQKAHIENQLTVHENETGNQVVVALVESLQGASVEEYSLQLARAWQLGQKGLDNGVLLLVAPTQRVARIEVGSGLENTLNNARTDHIMQNRILPSFKEGDYGRGIGNGVNAILESIGGHYHDANRLESNYNPPAEQRGARGLRDYFPLLFIAFIGLGHLAQGKSPGRRRTANAAFPAGFLGIAATAIAGNLFIGILICMVVFLLLLWLKERKLGDNKFDTDGFDHYPDEGPFGRRRHHHPDGRYHPDQHYRDSRYHEHSQDHHQHNDSSEDRNRYNRPQRSSSRSSGHSSGGGFSGGGGGFSGGGSSGSW